jgi:two-component system, NtrC family, response regulator
MQQGGPLSSACAPRRLLLVEDDPGLLSQLRWCFEGVEVISAEDRAGALAQLRRHEPAVVTLDLGLPPDTRGVSEGFAALEEILRVKPDAKVIVVTGHEGRRTAVEAVAAGAYDFYEKPIDPQILGLIVARAFRLHELEQENRKLNLQRNTPALHGIIGTSPQMLAVRRSLEKVAPTGATVLLLGESGTGKELLARALHELSARAEKSFVAINCAAIPETLLESELFGYERGAFTGAVRQTRGKIEYADGGTLLLDEVGDLPHALQAKLLRFLQERVIERVGGRGEIPLDVRVVCATHQDLPALIRAGRFRDDLYYRISEVTLRSPPLRERDGDAVVLARVFLEAYAAQEGRRLRGFTRDALAAIETYPWPGNVRELENRIKRAVIMAEGGQISAEDLELEAPDRPPAHLNLRHVRESAERQAVLRALTSMGGNVSHAAELLGVTRPTLYALMHKYSLAARE